MFVTVPCNKLHLLQKGSCSLSGLNRRVVMSNTIYRFSSASFEPRQLAVMTDAYEKAWVEIAGNFSPDKVPAARDCLAKVIVTIAPGWPHTVESLARAGVLEFQSQYRGAAR